MIKIVGYLNPEDFSKDKINKNERKRNNIEVAKRINEAMRHAIPHLNERMRGFHGVEQDFFDDQGAISQENFYKNFGQEAVGNDIRHADEQEKGFYNTHDLEVQEKYKTQDQDKIVEIIKEEERMGDGNISEELLFLLMNKVVGEDYIVMRSSKHDDFLNGTDLLLVDINTGLPVCAFDETVEGYNSRLSKKVERAQDKIKKGRGMSVKYGCTVEDYGKSKKVVFKELENIPPLFLALDKSDLRELLDEMDFNITSEVSSREKSAIQKMLSKIDDQIEKLDPGSDSRISYSAAKAFVEILRGKVA